MKCTRHKSVCLLSWFLLGMLYLEVIIYINPYINPLPLFIAILILIGEILIGVAWFAVGIVISGVYEMFMINYH
jgi:hypothetical protein